jgi:hypothetical protein
MAALYRKNVVNQVIRVGGPASNLRFFEDVFPMNPLDVNSKTVYNHYITDMDYNVYPAASASSTGADNQITFQIIKQSHSGEGMYSNGLPGQMLFDKDNQLTYVISNKDTSVPWGHKLTVIPLDGLPHTIKQNKGYLVVNAVIVPGYSCPNITNTAQSLGYVNQVNPIRFRRDWCVQFDLMRSYDDLIQFAVIYDRDGTPMDSWDLYETQNARIDLRAALNMYAFTGQPITNAALLPGGVYAVTDAEHPGFYGLWPTVLNGGGIVQDFDPAVGWDLEADWQPLMLYQDSLKRSTKFMVMHGKAFKAGMIDRLNRLVTRTGTGSLLFESYERLAINDTTVNDPGSAVRKLGIESYTYLGFKVDFMEVAAFSDSRYLGSNYYNNAALFIPADGIMVNNKPKPPVEFYQYGAEYTGGYEEHRVDNRDVTLCESLQGYVAQSFSMAVHGQNQFLMANPKASC